MSVRRPKRKSYYVAISRTDEPNSWRWEIRRKRIAMGVRLQAGGFHTHQAALESGALALEEFLNNLAITANPMYRIKP